MKISKSLWNGRNAATLALVSTLAVAGTASAATYKVTSGQSLQAVADKLAPGDVVEVAGGATYGAVRFKKAGTAAKKITIRGIKVNGKRPIISGGDIPVHFNANYYVFEGFEVTKGARQCIFHQGHDITIRDAVVHDCTNHGLLGADEGAGSLILEFSEFYNNGNGQQKHQIYMATDETAFKGSVFRMQHCYVHAGKGGNNVKSRAERNEIYYNWIEGALYHNLELIGPDGQNPGLAREDSDVVGNVISSPNGFYMTRIGGDGTGDTNGRYRFVNNTFISGGRAPFRIYDGIESVEMHNNVFYRPSGGAFEIYRQVEAKWVGGKEMISGSNNWVTNAVTGLPKTWLNTKKGTTAGFTNDKTPDVRLLAGSPLVNAGTTSMPAPGGKTFPRPLTAATKLPPNRVLGPAAARPVAGVIDIGAFELGTATKTQSMMMGGDADAGDETLGLDVTPGSEDPQAQAEPQTEPAAEAAQGEPNDYSTALDDSTVTPAANADTQAGDPAADAAAAQGAGCSAAGNMASSGFMLLMVLAALIMPRVRLRRATDSK